MIKKLFNKFYESLFSLLHVQEVTAQKVNNLSFLFHKNYIFTLICYILIKYHISSNQQKPRIFIKICLNIQWLNIYDFISLLVNLFYCTCRMRQLFSEHSSYVAVTHACSIIKKSTKDFQQTLKQQINQTMQHLEKHKVPQGLETGRCRQLKIWDATYLLKDVRLNGGAVC